MSPNLVMYIYPQDKAWNTHFLNESLRIRDCFSVDTQLHHVGGTAVDRLMSKNCIDIVGAVDSDFVDGLVSDISKTVISLEQKGYLYKG